MEKLHAAVARNTFASQNAQKTSGADRFLKFRCRKMARRCSEKQKMLKKLTGSEHFSQFRCGKIVEKWHAAVAGSIFTSQNVKNTCVLQHFGGSDVAKV